MGVTERSHIFAVGDEKNGTLTFVPVRETGEFSEPSVVRQRKPGGNGTLAIFRRVIGMTERPQIFAEGETA